MSLIMLKQTSLHFEHIVAGAQLVDFSGWDMPLHYGSQIEEHHQVRKQAGLFDVSHMGVVDIEGENTTRFLRYVFANDVARLKQGGALYTCMLNEKGGILDDLIVYRLSETMYRLVINAAVRDKDVAWLKKQSEGYQVNLKERYDLSIIALQGPQSDAVLAQLFDATTDEKIKALRPFQFVLFEDCLIARTGYTGESGIEIILPNAQAVSFWQQCLAQGAKPCGLGARDTLRLEAGFNLYGTDMNESTTPLESNLAWTVSSHDPTREFIGRQALEAQRISGVSTQLVGIVMEEPGVLRNHQIVYFNEGSSGGEITSGSFSPTLGHAIAFARVPVDYQGKPYIERRGKRVPVKVVSLPFIKLHKNIK
jgi:aminomethyltransferase